MDRLLFDAAFGNIVRKVEITLISGMEGTFHIYMDNYFIGSVGQRTREVYLHWGNNTEKSALKEETLFLGVDDVDAILGRLQDVGWI